MAIRWYHWIMRGIWVAWLSALFGLATGEIARAEIQEIDYVIDSSDNSSFVAVVQQAEGIAEDSIGRTFTEDPNVTEVSVKVAADRNGNLSPLLVVRVSRSEWQTQPHVQAWAHYLGNASVLLGFTGLPSSGSTVSVSSSPFVSFPSGPIDSNSEPNFYN